MLAETHKRLMSLFRKYDSFSFLVVLFIHTLLSVKTLFLNGIIVAGDNPVHYVNSYFTTFHILAERRIFGWDPFNNFGWVLNQCGNLGSNIFVSSIYYLFSSQIDFQLAYKITFFLVYFLLAPAVYIFVYALSEDKVAAMIASLLSVTTFTEEETSYGAGLKQMYYAGMWPERLGLIFVILGAALLVYTLQSKSLPKTLLLMGLCSLFFCAAILTHVTMGICTSIIAFLIWFFAFFRKLRDFFKLPNQRLSQIVKTETIISARVVSVAFLSLGMAAFWIVPFLNTLNTYYSFPVIIGLFGSVIFKNLFSSIPWLLLIFYCIGAFSSAFKKERFSYPSLVCAGIILFLQFVNLILADVDIVSSLIFATAISLILLLASDDLSASFLLASISIFGFLATGPDTYVIYFGPMRLDLLRLIPFPTNLAYSMFSSLARILVLCLTAIGFARLSHKLYSLSKKPVHSATFSIATGLLVFLIVNLSLGAQLQNSDLAYPWAGQKVFKSASDYSGFEKTNELINWIKNNVPENTYILFQDTADLGGREDFQTSHYIYMASLLSKRPIIGGCFCTNYITTPYANSEEGYLLGFKIEKFLEDNTLLPRLMDELGIGYIAVHDFRLVKVLNSSIDFKLEYYNEPYGVFKKINLPEIVFIDGKGTVKSVEFAINRVEVTVSNVSGNTSYLIVRQVNFPGFIAEADGEIIPIDMYYPKLPNVITGWHGIQPVFNWKIPFIKVKIPAGSNRVTLRFIMHTVGSDISKIAWAVFFCLLISGIALLIVRKLHEKW
jgi:hypothetical protein